MSGLSSREDESTVGSDASVEDFLLLVFRELFEFSSSE